MRHFGPTSFRNNRPIDGSDPKAVLALAQSAARTLDIAIFAMVTATVGVIAGADLALWSVFR